MKLTGKGCDYEKEKRKNLWYITGIDACDVRGDSIAFILACR